jgi:hypothetical protein
VVHQHPGTLAPAFSLLPAWFSRSKRGSSRLNRVDDRDLSPRRAKLLQIAGAIREPCLWSQSGLFVEAGPFALREGSVTSRRMEPYPQALSRIDADAADVRSTIADGLVVPARARALYAEALERLFRYPATDPDGLRHRIDEVLEPNRRARRVTRRRGGPRR